MRRAEVEQRVADILAQAGDPEIAHGDDDDLRRDFLRALAAGQVPADEIAACAEALLSTEDAFPRWCA